MLFFMKKNEFRMVILYGIAIFSMFFGSGNLVIPFCLGRISSNNWLIAFSGFFITAVLLPFAGLFVIKLYQGSYDFFFKSFLNIKSNTHYKENSLNNIEDSNTYYPIKETSYDLEKDAKNPNNKIRLNSIRNFFNCRSKIEPNIILSFLLLSLLGPFGVVPRCIAVAYGNVKNILNLNNYVYSLDINLLLFSLIFCFLCFLICRSEDFFINALGKYLGPILIALIILILFCSILNSPRDLNYTTEPNNSPLNNFKNGFLYGYQTMDLISAFFFSSVIFKKIKSDFYEKNNRDLIKIALKPSIFAVFLLSIIYLSFIYIGKIYEPIIRYENPESIISIVSIYSMGIYGTIILCVVVFLSCITTAVALINLYSKFISKSLYIDKKNFSSLLKINLLISFFISLMNFNGITYFLMPTLEVVYPSIIIVTIMSIFCVKNEYKNVAFKISAFLAIILKLNGSVFKIF